MLHIEVKQVINNCPCDSYVRIDNLINRCAQFLRPADYYKKPPYKNRQTILFLCQKIYSNLIMLN